MGLGCPPPGHFGPPDGRLRAGPGHRHAAGVRLPAGRRPSSPDLHAALRVQAMVVEFSGKSFADSTGATHPVTPDMVTNLQDTMNGSPVLASELKRAATTPNPQHTQHRIPEHLGFTVGQRVM